MNELDKSGLDAKVVGWFDSETGGLRTGVAFEVFSRRVREMNFIYLRHMFPVYHKIEYSGLYGVSGYNFREIVENIMRFASVKAKKNIDKTFNIQLRKKDKGVDLGDFVGALKEELKERGLVFDIKNKDFIVSGYLDEGYLYIGISDAEMNLSSWSGGRYVYSFQDDTISRAEFKLLEALDCFGIDLSECKNALDLGAAPGGWTKVLLQHGLKVMAVDPALLSETLKNHPNVTHFQGTAESFLVENKKLFDLVVNDMKMEVAMSTRIMNQMASFLKPGAQAIMTLKLHEKNTTKTIKKGIGILEEEYVILRVKQLFYNRMEVTVLAKKR